MIMQKQGTGFKVRCISACVASPLLCGISSGQSYSVRLDWQVSADNGGTWGVGLVEVPETQASVLVRLQASWTPTGTDTYFSGTSFDALIRTPGRTSGDSIDMYNFGIFPVWTRSVNTQGFRFDYFGDVLKVDDVRDSSPPGVGSRWVTPTQLPPQYGTDHRENPTILFSYRLALDGVPGPREISGLFRVSSQTGHTTALYIDFGSIGTWVPSTVNNTTVLVVPSPASAWLVLGMSTLLVRRRERNFLPVHETLL